MQWVKQEEAMGCGVACLAMVLNEDYFTARLRFKRQDFTSKGMLHLTLDRRVAEAGFSIQRLYPGKGKSWPPLPFAPVHICRVRVPGAKGRFLGSFHYVVMDKDGVVFDPSWEEQFIPHDYPRVLDVAGLFPVARKVRIGG
jgi:hypothetical protein